MNISCKLSLYILYLDKPANGGGMQRHCGSAHRFKGVSLFGVGAVFTVICRH